MRLSLFSFGMALAVAVVTTATSRSDVPPTDTAPADEPVVPASAEPPRAPFTPYDIGPRPEAAWPYESLTADEKVVADKGLNEDYAPIHDGYAAAVRLRSQQAMAEAAAQRLGVENLESGVVP